MNKTAILYTFLLVLFFNFLFSGYTHSPLNSNIEYAYYDSLYKKSLDYIKNEKIEKSLMLLNEIVLNQHINRNDILIMNAHYDLGQIYLSRALNYNQAINHFEYIFNNVYSNYGSEKLVKGMKSLSELKEKSLFMLGYIYHNHIGNFTIAKSYYATFLNQFPNNELSFSVQYELELIENEIMNFKNK